MSPKQRFNLMLEPTQLAGLKAIEEATGAPIAEQIRRAVDVYLDTQTAIAKAEMKRILRGD